MSLWFSWLVSVVPSSSLLAGEGSAAPGPVALRLVGCGFNTQPGQNKDCYNGPTAPLPGLSVLRLDWGCGYVGGWWVWGFGLIT